MGQTLLDVVPPPLAVVNNYPLGSFSSVLAVL